MEAALILEFSIVIDETVDSSLIDQSVPIPEPHPVAIASIAALLTEMLQTFNEEPAPIPVVPFAVTCPP
jgi:hypothetical protein